VEYVRWNAAIYGGKHQHGHRRIECQKNEQPYAGAKAREVDLPNELINRHIERVC
jgi:hypothetical protein